jgi:hypothetical protein
LLLADAELGKIVTRPEQPIEENGLSISGYLAPHIETAVVPSFAQRHELSDCVFSFQNAFDREYSR